MSVDLHVEVCTYYGVESAMLLQSRKLLLMPDSIVLSRKYLSHSQPLRSGDGAQLLKDFAPKFVAPRMRLLRMYGPPRGCKGKVWSRRQCRRPICSGYGKNNCSHMTGLTTRPKNTRELRAILAARPVARKAER
jgi:hypothetical protein